MSSSTQTFFCDAVLFDMDGTLTDSISAVEAAWGKVAKDIGQDPQEVIAATHGKRAIDNLAQFKPDIKEHEMDKEVTNFEETILYFADAYNLHGPGSQKQTPIGTADVANPLGSGHNTPAMTASSSAPSSRPHSRAPSMSASQARRPSFSTRLLSLLTDRFAPRVFHEEEDVGENAIEEENDDEQLEGDAYAAWELEAASVDRSVHILPGVKELMDSIPAGRYAVATSGAKTYAYGCMNRVGITPPPVTITADDKRLKAGKPAPDPFLLAAKCLGYKASDCVVFEDSPSGIRAGVASGATVVALCTSHERSKIENCGAHYIVENMESVKCVMEGDKLKFTLSL